MIFWSESAMWRSWFGRGSWLYDEVKALFAELHYLRHVRCKMCKDCKDACLDTEAYLWIASCSVDGPRKAKQLLAIFSAWRNLGRTMEVL